MRYYEPMHTSVATVCRRLVEKLLHRLADFLIERHSDKKTLIGWRHRIYRTMCLNIYLGFAEPPLSASQKARQCYRHLMQLFTNDGAVRLVHFLSPELPDGSWGIMGYDMKESFCKLISALTWMEPITTE